MKKKGKNKIPAVDNSPPIVPNIEPQLQKKVSDELIKGFEWYFPNEHSTYRELIDKWFLPVSFISLLKRRDSHLKKLENPKVRFKDIVQNKVKQCDNILIMFIDRWIEHNFELIDEMKAFNPTLQSESVKKKTQIINKEKNGIPGRPPNPKIAERNKKISRDYYKLTQEKGYTRKKAIKILAKENNLAESTIETYLK